MIAFAGKDGEFFDIYLYFKKEDVIVQLTNDEAMAGQPQFSPDGEKIVYHSNKSGTFQLYKIDLGKPVTIEEIQHLFNSNMK
jgi:Tol biopolymer transport system component